MLPGAHEDIELRPYVIGVTSSPITRVFGTAESRPRLPPSLSSPDATSYYRTAYRRVDICGTCVLFRKSSSMPPIRIALATLFKMLQYLAGTHVHPKLSHLPRTLINERESRGEESKSFDRNARFQNST